MTTLATLSPPLERLFDRIDAAEPGDAYLRALLDIWRARLPFNSSQFEVMVAPLASDGRRVDAVFGGIGRNDTDWH